MIPIRTIFCALCALALPMTTLETSSTAAWAQELAAATSNAATATADEDTTPDALTEEQLEELVAPIALYPDELLALIAAAAIYPLQVVEAQRFLDNKKSDPDAKPKSTWDGSIIALLNYPEVVKMMSDDLEWTQNLGTAIAYQQKDLLIAIQQLRDEAVADDILKSDDKMKVSEEGDNVVIESASSTQIYVPQYPPEMLYEDGYAEVPIYYSEPYPYYYDWDDSDYFPGFWTGAFWGAAIDWDDWGVWGGDIDGGIDIDCNRCGNDINIGDKIDIGDIDWRGDRDKLTHFDRSKLTGDRGDQIRNNIKNNNANSVRDRASNIKRDEGSKAAKAKDVRAKSQAKRAEGVKPGEGNRAANAKSKANNAKAKAGRSNNNKASAARGNSSKAKAKAGKPKAGSKAKASSRSKKPSAMGEVRSGKSSKVNSSRGKKSMSRSGGSNRSYSRGGGGGRSMSRGGGGRSGGGGGRGGGGRGGGGRR